MSSVLLFRIAFFISEVLNAEACLCHALVALRAHLTKANSVESAIGIIEADRMVLLFGILFRNWASTCTIERYV